MIKISSPKFSDQILKKMAIDFVFLGMNIYEILDLPKKDGREVLREIKEDDVLKSIPVEILTTSGAEKDILGAYDLHANAYIIKPLDFDQLIDVVKSIACFWLEIVKLPG